MSVGSGRLRPGAAAVTTTRPPTVRAQELVDGLGVREHVDIVIPRTQVKGKLRLVTRAERFKANADARTMLSESGFPVDASAIGSLGAGEQWQYELAAHLFSVAVRNPDNPKLALAPIEDWRECDDDQIAALNQIYKDLADRIDPMGEGTGLTEAEEHALIAAAKKKDVALLMSYGSRALAIFAITSVDPPASSQTPTS